MIKNVKKIYMLLTIFILPMLTFNLHAENTVQEVAQVMINIKKEAEKQPDGLSDTQSAYFKKWEVVNDAKDLTEKDVAKICASFDEPHEREGYGHDYFPGAAIDECEQDFNNAEAIRKCIFNRGSNIDIAKLYANGEYVKQSLPKALAYVCYGYTEAPMEKISMVKFLYSAVMKGSLDKEFDFCNHATASQSISVCFSQKQDKAFRDINTKFKQLPNSFTDKQKQSYNVLLQSAFEFFDTRAQNEQDLSGSLRSIFITESERDQRKWFLNILEKLEAHKIVIEKADYTNIKHEMDQVYQQLMAHKEKAYQAYIKGEANLFIRKDSIEFTQSQFPIFRDNFANFIHLRYPKISEDNAKAWLTKIRIIQLKEMFDV